jgi:hypothetical protein
MPPVRAYGSFWGRISNLPRRKFPSTPFADNFTPTPYATMTRELELFHTFLTPARAEALAGFSVFHFDGYAAQFPDPRNIADLDGDGDADTADLAQLTAAAGGPMIGAVGLARDGDLNLDGAVDLRDFAALVDCFTGAGVTGPIADHCQR